jgi:hypothetical protein
LNWHLDVETQHHVLNGSLNFGVGVSMHAQQTCGVCKDVRRRFAAMAIDAAAARARVVFLEADALNEYDYASGACAPLMMAGA